MAAAAPTCIVKINLNMGEPQCTTEIVRHRQYDTARPECKTFFIGTILHVNLLYFKKMAQTMHIKHIESYFLLLNITVKRKSIKSTKSTLNSRVAVKIQKLEP